MTKTVPQILTDCILGSISEDSREFQWDLFFLKWFRSHGTPTFFLFHRHLGVTNTQYIELFSLLELHCRKSTKYHPTQHYLFHTTEQFRSLLLENINIFLDTSEENQRAQVTAFAEIYEELFASSIVVDMFYCSCAVFLPPGLTLDLSQMTSDAGYIHSAGRSVFIRNFDKSKRNHFENSIDTYLAQVPEDELPIRFVVYAHEDFSAYDRSSRSQIERGIQNVKLYVDKLNMGIYGLSKIVDDMRHKFKKRLTIPEPGSYIEMHAFNTKKTLWLINDRSISTGDSRNPGRSRYYICYEQLVKNENPLVIFDENKPAWKSHTTLPHTLTAALLNITRSTWSCDGKLCDPFGGTGTTWFEAKRLVPEVEIQCTDKDAVTQRIVEDNVLFFSLETPHLESIGIRLKKLQRAVTASERTPVDEPIQELLDLGIGVQITNETDHYASAKSLLEELKNEQPSQEQEFEMSSGFVERLERAEFFTRFVFYVCLRAELRFGGGYARKAITFEKAFSDSIDELTEQIQHLVSLRRHIDVGFISENGNYVTCSGRYSESVIPSEFIGKIGSGVRDIRDEVFSRDACRLPEDAFDAIICDPPYGFNTSIDHLELTRLYSKFLDVALKSLKRRGHLILCLPAQSYTGRDLPLCTKSDLVVNQVLTKAGKMDREVILPGRNIPRSDFVPPYYWEADRALRRVILHFQFI